MKKPKVSIVITTYNRLFYLAELMESLSRQTFRGFEVIVVNDCGEKVDIIKEIYSNLDITIVEMERNLKMVHARNEGVKRAKGEYIMLMDDDDLLVPTHLETMVKAIGDNDLVYSDVEIVQFEVENNIRKPINRLLFAYEVDLEAMRTISTFVPSGCLYRKALHDIIGLFDPAVHNYWDWDFFLRVAEKHRIERVAIAGVLYDFSDRNNNLSKGLSTRQQYLDRLSAKHNLGQLSSENFFTLLKKPELIKRKAKSTIVWDGEVFISKLT